MKPLLVIPPAADRWPALRELPVHNERIWQDDLEKRFSDGVPGSQDAFCVVPDGGMLLACAAVCKRHDLGVLNRVFVRDGHRGSGLARAMISSLVSWFEMTGGRWLYVTTTLDLADGLFAKLGFRTLRQTPREPHDHVVLLHAPDDAPADPLSTADGTFSIHDVTRANWPTIATLLFNRAGFDPRLTLDESAMTAETTALELLARQEEGTCHLKAAFHGQRLVGLATVATDTPGEKTYAMTMPHTDVPPQLREAIVKHARSCGYERVDFPMESLVAPKPPKQQPPESAEPRDSE